MKAMILAAGRGERMRPLTDECPKPLLRAGDKPLLQYHLEALARAGIQEVLINLAWKGAMIRETFGDGRALGLRIQYSDEGTAALETGGGIFKALPQLGPEPFLVVSGDVWTDFDFASVATQLSAADLAHFVLVPNPPFHQKGDLGVVEGRIMDAEPRYTYANIGVFRPEFFAACSPGKFALAPLMFAAARAGRVSGELYTGRWFNVGTPQQLAELDRALRA